MRDAWRGWTGRPWAAAMTMALGLALGGCGGGGGDSPNPDPVTHALTVAVTGSGTVTGGGGAIDCGSACSTNVPTNTSITLTATPAAGARFAAWGGECSGAAATCTVTMDTDKAVSATFEPTGGGGGTTYALDVAVTGQGSVASNPGGIQCGTTCSASFAADTAVTLTATPAQGQVLSAWGGACSGQGTTCAVTMSAARTVSATFAAAPVGRAWQTAELLESNGDFNVGSTVLTTIDAAGNALTVWQQIDGTPDVDTRKVFSRRYVAGQGWSAAVVVPGLETTSSSVNLITGKLVADAGGDVTWVRHNFETRRFSPATGWSSAFTAGTLPSRFLPVFGDARVDASGAVHVGAYAEGKAWHASLPAGASAWSAWTDLTGNAASANVTGGVRLALSTNGSAIMVWRERNPGDSNDSVWANRSVNGTWQTRVRIEEVLTDATETPGLAMDANGNAIAAWHQGNSIYANRFDAAAGTWGTATEFDAGQASSTFDADVEVVMAADGRAAVAWDSGIFAMKAMSYVPATGFTAPVVVAPYNVDRAMGIDSQGRVVVVYRSPTQWPNPTEATLNVYARSMTVGDAWSDAALVETGAGDTNGGLVFSMNDAGQAVAAWVQNDIANSDVRKSLWANLLR